MIPFLVAIAIAAIGALVGVVMWVVEKVIDEAKSAAHQFRTDVMTRLGKQDDMMRDQGSTMHSIRDLLTAEVHKIREKLVNHESRINAVERQAFPLRRHEDKTPGSDD